MSLFISSINSGSNGNCYYIGNSEDAVLIDIGISCRETEKRLNRLGIEISKIRGIFISHEHTDHISGAEVFSRKHKIPVHISERTLRNSRLKIEPELLYHFSGHTEIHCGSLKVSAFPKLHDATDPYSFNVYGNGIKTGILTDIGTVCDKVIESFKDCHAVFLEANYDEKMLSEGPYPYYLKERISGMHGHLSNRQALELFLNHRSEKLSLVLLSHLSKENNHPDLAHEFFSQHAGDTKIVVASRHNESPLYKITEQGLANLIDEIPVKSDEQLLLFKE